MVFPVKLWPVLTKTARVGVRDGLISVSPEVFSKMGGVLPLCARNVRACEAHDWELTMAGVDVAGASEGTHGVMVEAIRCHRSVDGKARWASTWCLRRRCCPRKDTDVGHIYELKLICAGTFVHGQV